MRLKQTEVGIQNSETRGTRDQAQGRDEQRAREKGRQTEASRLREAEAESGRSESCMSAIIWRRAGGREENIRGGS